MQTPNKADYFNDIYVHSLYLKAEFILIRIYRIFIYFLNKKSDNPYFYMSSNLNKLIGVEYLFYLNKKYKNNIVN